MSPGLSTLLILLLAQHPQGFADLKTIAPEVEIDMRYAGKRNFMGRRVRGYEAPKCLLTVPAAEALARVQARLRSQSLGLLVHDCYRPQRAVDDFASWAKSPEASMKPLFFPKVDKSRLFALQYIAHRSGHSRGSTVDLTLTALDGRRPDETPFVDCPSPPGDGARGLNMGTPWDCFSEASATESDMVPPAARARRLLLRKVMSEAGFRNYRKEWWHYTLREEPHPKRYFDFPIR
ncbi:MAG: M15 family metallopeptidase [Myxococcota bacterium]